MTPIQRRHLILAAAGAALAPSAFSQTSSASAAPASPARRFEPQPGTWRSFEITTQVELRGTAATAAQVWVPLPSVTSGWQRTGDDSYSGNATQTKVVSDSRYGARMLQAQFAAGSTPSLVVSSRFDTQNRATTWNQKAAAQEDAATLRYWTQGTELIPTDGIVRDTARMITQGQKTDVAKVQALYDWIVENTYREPKVRGCGVGDIKAMLETRNLGGKCADLNALFVGMCRAVGVPARDVYGIRLVPSAFGYKELGGNPSNLKGAQHCRAEVFLKDHGWTAMDPADVCKVMRQETAEWIKDPKHALVAPVKTALFGGWEGNWLAFNMAHDVALPGSTGPRLGFLMYPQAELDGQRVDSLSPDDFKYSISAREITRV